MSGRWLAWAAFVLLVCAIVFLERSWIRPRLERQEALHLVATGRFPDAEPLLGRALLRNPQDVEVVSALAVGKWAATSQEAEGYLTRWATLCPREARPFRLRMDLRHRQGRGMRGAAEGQRLLEGALADGERVLELEPDNDEVRREVIWLQLRVGRFPDAEQTCRRSLKQTPGDLWLAYLLARACHGQDKRAEAIRLIDPVVLGQPDFAQALLLRGTLYRESDQPEQAIAMLRRALRLKDCPRKEGLYQLGLALASGGQEEEAKRVMAEIQLTGLRDAVARDNFPDNTAMRVQIAEALLGAGKTDEARALVEQILVETPGFAPALRVRELYQGKPMKQSPKGDKAP